MSIIAPKVFISYSWDISDKVLEFAERLVNPGGVDVVLDKWDLKEGQDKYVFMEQAVNNPEITHVLIICDETYLQKSNGRKGGVGDETVIISAEVYGKVEQKKFIPIVFERDDEGNPFLPTYIKTRVYIDLSDDDNYEEQYEKLLRNLHDKPEHKKPKLSSPPEWLNDEDVSLSTIRDLLRQLNGDKGNNPSKLDFLTRKLSDELSMTLNSLGLSPNETHSGEFILKQLEATKPLRDHFIVYIEHLISKNLPVGEIVSVSLENLYNSMIDSTLDYSSYYPDNLEVHRFFIWESFICTIAILLHYERYASINEILTRTFFLKDRQYGENSTNFLGFYHDFSLIEGRCKPLCSEPRLHTLAGDIVVKREKKPLITGASIADADLLLYQMSCAFNKNDSWNWFPKLYCYRTRGQGQNIWKRLKSKKHCEKLYPLFGVNTIEELKNIISRCVNDIRYSYSGGSFSSAPNILYSIELSEIGTMN